MLQSAAEMYAEWWQAIDVPEIGRSQRREMRRSFYAGLFCMLCECEKVGEPAVSEAEAVAHFERLKHEIDVYFQRLMKGHE